MKCHGMLPFFQEFERFPCSNCNSWLTIDSGFDITAQRRGFFKRVWEYFCTCPNCGEAIDLTPEQLANVRPWVLAAKREDALTWGLWGPP